MFCLVIFNIFRKNIVGISLVRMKKRQKNGRKMWWYKGVEMEVMVVWISKQLVFPWESEILILSWE